jgi:hypothetical protein
LTAWNDLEAAEVVALGKEPALEAAADNGDQVKNTPKETSLLPVCVNVAEQAFATAASFLASDHPAAAVRT